MKGAKGGVFTDRNSFQMKVSWKTIFMEWGFEITN